MGLTTRASHTHTQITLLATRWWLPLAQLCDLSRFEDVVPPPPKRLLFIMTAPTHYFRDRRSLFPENPRPPPGLDSCVCAHVFFGLAPSSRTTLERVGQPNLVLSSRFWAFPDPYYTIPGRNRASQLFFIMKQAGTFLTDTLFQNEQNRTKKRYKSQKFDFAKLEHAGDFENRCGLLETFSRWFPSILRVDSRRYSRLGTNFWVFQGNPRLTPLRQCHFRAIIFRHSKNPINTVVAKK